MKRLLHDEDSHRHDIPNEVAGSAALAHNTTHLMQTVLSATERPEQRSIEEEADILVEKYAASIPPEDRRLTTKAQIDALVFAYKEANALRKTHIFSAADYIGNLPGPVMEMLYGRDLQGTRDGLNLLRENPLTYIDDQNKLTLIAGKATEFPDSIRFAFAHIIYLEGEHPPIELLLELGARMEKTENLNDLFGIAVNMSSFYAPKFGTRGNEVRAAAYKGLVDCCFPQFSTLQEVVLLREKLWLLKGNVSPRELFASLLEIIQLISDPNHSCCDVLSHIEVDTCAEQLRSGTLNIYEAHTLINVLEETLLISMKKKLLGTGE